MWAADYWANRYWAARYWAKVGAAYVAPTSGVIYRRSFLVRRRRA